MDGFVLIDKPAGRTSRQTCNDVLAQLGLRGGRRGIKVGHAGTLDPFATGLLIVMLGRATRLMQYVVGHDKTYELEVRLGATSTTDDCTGVVTEAVGTPLTAPSRPAILAALSEIASRSTQLPPQVSALHVDGVRAWRRVKDGEQVDVQPRDVRIDSITLDGVSEDPSGAPLVSVTVRCGAGTYMRSIARDLGELLQTGGLASRLRRTGIGSLDVSSAVRPDELTAGDVTDPLQLVQEYAVVDVDWAQVADLSHGRRVNIGDVPDNPVVAVRGPDHGLVAMAQVIRSPDSVCALQPSSVFISPVFAVGSSS